MTNIKNNEAQKFYTKILPKRLENVKKNFKGTPEELKEVLEDMEEDLTAEFWDDLDKKIEQEKENLENKYKIHRQDMNLQKEGSQTLATEIICDQKKEIEKLKAELQREKARHRKPEYITEYRKIIMETVDKIQNEQILRYIYIIVSDIAEESLKKKEVLTIKSQSKLYHIAYRDIEYIESQGRSCHIFTTNGKCYATNSKLSDLQNELNDKRFLRCHQSFLVNMDHIQSADENFIMDSGDSVSIRRRNYHEIKENYEKYIKH